MGDALEKIGYKAVVEGFATFDQNMQKMSKDVNQVGAAMDKEAASTSKATAASKDNASAMDKLSKSVMKGYDSYLEFAAQAGIAYGVLKSAYEVVNAVIEPTIELAEQERELQLMTGATAEEAGKLIQAADDCFVSFETLSMGMKNAIRKGFEPTVEGLGKMSDEYNAIQDPIEKTNYLMSVFGKSGSDVAELMSKGSDAIAEMGQAAYDAGLVLSQDGVDAAYDYKRALDNLSDSLLAMKLAIGVKLIPELNKAADAMELILTWEDKVQEASEENAYTIRDTAISYDEYYEGIQRSVDAMGAYIIKTDTEIAIMGRVDGEIKNVTADLGFMTRQQWDLYKKTSPTIDAIKEQGKAMDAASVSGDNLALTLQNMTDMIDESETGFINYTEKMEELEIFMSGKLGKTIDDYNDKQGDIKDKMNDIITQISELEGTKYLTEEQKAQLANLETEYKDLATQYQENADAHRLATAQILLDLTQQQLAVSDIPIGEQYEIISALAESWGLIDETTANVYQTIGLYIDQLDKGTISAGEFASVLENIPTEINVSVNLRDNAGNEYFSGVNNQNVGSGSNTSGSNSHSNAHSKGANFIVPPGFNNDTYPLGYAETGEHVIIIPRNQTNSNIYNQQRSNQFNINVSAVNPIQSVYQSYRMARLAIQ